MKKILVVDDEPDALRMLTLTLEIEGYEVVTAASGQEAIRQAVKERPDLIVLDVMMPQMDGYEVSRRLRRMPDFAQIPIIFLSARSQVEDTVQGLRAGGNDYITKPVSPQELVARIRAFLDSSHIAPLGYVAALFGSKNGVGTTTIAVNLALALLQQAKKSVILVDGHDDGGDVGIFLNILYTHHAGELMESIDQLDQELVKNILVKHPSGLRVLLAPPDNSAALTISPPDWAQMLAKLRQIADFTIFDGPPLRSTSWTPVLDSSDDIFLITTPEISAMKRLGTARNIARLQRRVPVSVHVLLNRYTEQSGFSINAIKRTLDTPIRLSIEDVGPSNTYAINHGVPLVLSDRRSPLTRAISRFAREIIEQHPSAAAPQEKKQRPGLLRRLFTVL